MGDQFNHILRFMAAAFFADMKVKARRSNIVGIFFVKDRCSFPFRGEIEPFPLVMVEQNPKGKIVINLWSEMVAFGEVVPCGHIDHRNIQFHRPFQQLAKNVGDAAVLSFAAKFVKWHIEHSQVVDHFARVEIVELGSIIVGINSLGIGAFAAAALLRHRLPAVVFGIRIRPRPHLPGNDPTRTRVFFCFLFSAGGK